MPLVPLRSNRRLALRRSRPLALAGIAALTWLTAACSSADPPPETARADRFTVLLLGDDGPHAPAERLRDIARPLLDRGIYLDYTEDLAEVTPGRLRRYGALIVYGDHGGSVAEAPQGSAEETAQQPVEESGGEIAQESGEETARELGEEAVARSVEERMEALAEWVRAGGGLVVLHSASGSFPDSETFGRLLGARPEGETSRGAEAALTGAGDADVPSPVRIVDPEHEIVRGSDTFGGPDAGGLAGLADPLGFRAHVPLGGDLTVVATRGDAPHTWVRSEGAGRVFFTAWGHDGATWANPAFHDLVERAVLWAAGQDPLERPAGQRPGAPFEYAVLDVPFPPPHEGRLEYERDVGPMDRGSNNPRWYRMQLPLDPETAISRMVVRPGFRVELFAAEPDVVNPIAMSWDERGRLWVVESVEYPYPRELWPDGGGKDRIRILEDTDRDGRADRFTTFAEGLNIPTAIAFARGGVIVHQAPHTLFLQDTTGDGRADVREVLFEGWSQSDTHAGPSNLRYGLDNWYWGTVGYAGMEGTVGGESEEFRHEFRMGVYRFRGDGSRLEFLGRTSNNTWGLGLDEAGEAFVSTANREPSTHLAIPRRHFDRLADLTDPVTESLADNPRIITLTNLFRQVDWVGGYTSAAGHAIYTARTWPREYWNKVAFVNEPTGQLVGEFHLSPDGSGFSARHPRNLVASDDEWFSPVVTDVGPDGHVWMADWYNYVLQHNRESDRQEAVAGNAYANPLRDREHGRIYRIVYEGAESGRAMSLEGASPAELVEALAHPVMLWRSHAQRLLVERGEGEVVPGLLELVRDDTVDEVGLNAGAVHALWTLQGLGRLGPDAEAGVLEAAIGALAHRSPAVRRNAAQVLPHTSEALDALLESGLLRDPYAQVRRAAVLAIGDHPASVAAGESLFETAASPALDADRTFGNAVALAAATHPEGFLAAAADAGVTIDAAIAAPGAEDPLTLAEIVGMIAREHPDALPPAAAADGAGEPLG